MRPVGDIQIFVKQYMGLSGEKQHAQSFVRDMVGLFDVGGVVIEFEKPVMVEGTQKYIDAYFPATKVLVEMKSADKKLDATVWHQAKRYADNLSYDDRPRYIVLSNMREFVVYDMNRLTQEPEHIGLEELPKELYRLQFIVDAAQNIKPKEHEISREAANLVGKLYDKLAEQFGDKIDYHALNKLCTRLVFLLYAEDAGIFLKDQFSDYLKLIKEPTEVRKTIFDIFRIINTPTSLRDPFDKSPLAAFPYVNGGLFADRENEPTIIPPFNRDICDLLIYDCGLKFDWSPISPVIFGSLFESTLNAETRRKGGMHYTSVENIHKVIDTLFLNDLRAELDNILQIPIPTEKVDSLLDFQNKLASIKILDPACGSGNFLTETFLSLSRLENEALTVLKALKTPNLQQKVSIAQFYGIEINDFAAEVAQSALWIAEHQQYKKAEEIIGKTGNYLPLKSYPNITCANALKVEWERGVDYIIGNPPFVGAKYCSAEQKADAVAIFGKIPLANSLDFVVAWFHKAAQMMQADPHIKACLVATNSICQGEQVAAVWKPLYEKYGIHIQFAYRTFRWDSESNDKAAVHCVVVGFNTIGNGEKTIYDGDKVIKAQNINGYLLDAPSVFIEKTSSPICDVPTMMFGSMPNDGGNFILSEKEKQEVLAKEPKLEPFIYRFMGADDFLNGKTRYCFWLKNAPPQLLHDSKILKERIAKIRELRLNSTTKPTREKAATPHLFFFTSHPEDGSYLLFPSTSSERREYVPLGFMSTDTVASNACSIIPSATLYHFGVLTSSVHMAWMRLTAGRLKSDYRYSGSVVYNTFPWCEPTESQKAEIEATAQAILDVRAKYPNTTLAALYDPLTMPADLRKAHRENDKAVLAAYGWDKGMDEGEMVRRLMGMYEGRK